MSSGLHFVIPMLMSWWNSAWNVENLSGKWQQNQWRRSFVQGSESLCKVTEQLRKSLMEWFLSNFRALSISFLLSPFYLFPSSSVLLFSPSLCLCLSVSRSLCLFVSLFSISISLFLSASLNSFLTFVE